MRLLLIADWTFPCNEPFMREVYAKRWQQAGHEVCWVMRPSGSDAKSRRTWNEAPVFIAPASAYGYVTRVINELRSQIGWLQTVWDTMGPFDVVQVRNDLSMGLAANRLATQHDVPFIFRHSHLKAETLRLGAREGVQGYGPMDYLKGTIGMSVRDYLIDLADLCLPISEAMADYHRNRGIGTELRAVPMGADTLMNSEDADVKRFRSSYSLQNTRYLLYTGSMNPLRRLEFLFDVLEQVMYDESDVQLVLVGGRNDRHRQRLRNYALDRGVSDSVTFTGWVSNETVHEAIAGAALGLSPLPPNNVFAYNSPAKVFEYLNLQTPAVGTRTAEQIRVIERSGAGRVVDYDSAAFADVIVDFLADPRRRRHMGNTGRVFIQENCSYDRLFQQVQTLTCSLLNK